MRIAFISLMGGLPWGGSEQLWHAVALHALEQGDDVFVSVFDWGTLPPKMQQLKEKGARLSLRKKEHTANGRLQKMVRLLTGRRPPADMELDAILDFNPDVLFINQAETFDFALYYMHLYHRLLQRGISYVIICHSYIQQYSFIPPAQIYPEAVDVFKKAGHVYFVSARQWELTERRLVSRLDNASFTWNPLNMVVPDSPVPLPEFNPVKFAIVGSFLGYKGQDTAMEILSRPEWRERAWVLNLYGEGHGWNYLQSLAAYYNLADRVKFCGFEQNIQNIWAENHIMLIPSAQEGLPISLVEAMACGRPAIVTDVGGNRELIVENSTGFVAAAPSVQSFGEAMERAWQCRANWQQMGINSFSQITERLNTRPQVNVYEQLKVVASAQKKMV